MDEPKPKGQGEFFNVDRKTWEAAAKLGLNPAVAFLVLARFSDKSNTNTSASVHAVEEHTGISRGRAKVAVDALLKNGLIRRTNAPDAVRPRYEIHVPKSKPEPIWLPNAIVTGASDEEAPIEQLRQVQNVLLLRLFVDLYRLQNLRESHGIDRQILWRSYTKVSAGSAAQFDLWRFVPGQKFARASAEPAFDWRVYGGKGDKEASANFWRVVEVLEVLRLIDWVPHLYESDTPDGEVLHACGTGGTESIEDQVGQAAHDAALALIERKLGSEPAEAPWLVPIRRHLVNVTMVGVARLKYRPRTSLTSSWWAEHRKKGEAALADFQNIRERAAGLRP